MSIYSQDLASFQSPDVRRLVLQEKEACLSLQEEPLAKQRLELEATTSQSQLKPQEDEEAHKKKRDDDSDGELIALLANSEKGTLVEEEPRKV